MNDFLHCGLRMGVKNLVCSQFDLTFQFLSLSAVNVGHRQRHQGAEKEIGLN